MATTAMGMRRASGEEEVGVKEIISRVMDGLIENKDKFCCFAMPTEVEDLSLCEGLPISGEFFIQEMEAAGKKIIGIVSLPHKLYGLRLRTGKWYDLFCLPAAAEAEMGGIN